MIRQLRLSLVTAVLLLGACASIPPEAPELSAELGNRITAIEVAHTRLVEQFFAEKRQRIDNYVQEVWVPIFAGEFFGDPKVDEVWKQVVASTDPQDRLRFITLVGARLQEKINRKRLELVKPLEDLERDVKSKLKIEYDQARGINNTLTSFLKSTAKVEANRIRYLEMIGVTDKQVDKFIDDTDQAVSDLVGKAKSAQDKVKDGEAFLNKIKSIASEVKSS